MLSTSQKILHRARSLRRLHIHSQCSDDDMTPVPTTPVTPTMPVSIPMPLPPTQRPNTEYYSQPHHYRQASTCSHVSRASSSWSSNASTTSSTCSSHNNSLEWDPLRLHPPAKAADALPQFDASRFYFHDDEECFACGGGAGSPTPVPPTMAAHGFDFGFEPARSISTSSSSRRAGFRRTTGDIHLASSEEPFVAQGLSPPPRHHRLRAHQSEANLQQKSLRHQQLGADRPSTPPVPALPTSAPSSPVRPREQPAAATESERYFKRGDWKRRGIIFGAYGEV